ncbi:ABC transporter ATP-binding protein [Neisseria leonii]|uniref:ABC transporter ATP-binding protein n=1 Tax=Neisseria leonii TaxID=2995413 RepID=UPI00237A12E7|nr:ABC transporter ATP-binding protein [Neisseria sp. 3986]MDD9325283.1 ABC transporter ATP-binding protein [Neisseria sp. 3986]
MLKAENITLSYQNQTVIEHLSFSPPEQKITVFIGANGCGKSTLLKSYARQLPPQNGNIILNGEDIYQTSGRQTAKQLAMLAQSATAPEHLTAEQLVRYGRYPHRQLLARWSDEDENQVNQAMLLTGIQAYSARFLADLSGGQRQRVWIAMVLAQNTPYILLDEPTTYLDLAYQIEILDLLQTLNRTQRKTIVMVLHDLNLAARYADYVAAVKNKTVICSGSPQQVFTEDNIRNILNLDCKIITDPYCGTPLCIPLGSSRPPDQIKR